MHAIILAGGKGLRLRELTEDRPKGLLQIGDRAMIDHIVFHLSRHHVDSITVAAGFRAGDFAHHFANRDATGPHVEVVDTGKNTNTGGRLKRLEHGSFAMLPATEPVILCWSDGLSDIDFSAMVAQHVADDKIVTLAAAHPPARLGELQLDGKVVTRFAEKPPQTDRWINGGYFVTTKAVLPLIQGDQCSWETDVLVPLSEQRQLGAYRHDGAWQCMDTLHDHIHLNDLFDTGQAFWPLSEGAA